MKPRRSDLITTGEQGRSVDDRIEYREEIDRQGKKRI